MNGSFKMFISWKVNIRKLYTESHSWCPYKQQSFIMCSYKLYLPAKIIDQNFSVFPNSKLFPNLIKSTNNYKYIQKVNSYKKKTFISIATSARDLRNLRTTRGASITSRNAGTAGFKYAWELVA